MSDFMFTLIGIVVLHAITVCWQFVQGRRRRATADLIFGAAIVAGVYAVPYAIRRFDSDPIGSVLIAAGGVLVTGLAGWLHTRWLRAPAASLRTIQLPDLPLRVHSDEIRTPESHPPRFFGYSYDWTTGQMASRRIVLGSAAQSRYQVLRWLQQRSRADAVEVHFVLYDNPESAERSLKLASSGTLELLRATGVYRPSVPEVLDEPMRGVVLTRWRGNDWGNGVQISHQASLSHGRLSAFVCGQSRDAVVLIMRRLRGDLVDVSLGAIPL